MKIFEMYIAIVIGVLIDGVIVPLILTWLIDLIGRW
jgi:hypothetical protein